MSNKILSEDYHLKEYLWALARLKATHHSNNLASPSNLCFGAYDRYNEACYSQSRSSDYLICQVCRAQVERPSAEWIKDFLEVL